MRATREIAIIGAFTALLIGGQLALSAVSGVEIVTVLLLCFSYYFGIRRGLAVATAFSLLRCFIFGFFPSVIILYLVYYNLFALIIGFAGNKLNRRVTAKTVIILCVLAGVLTVCFSLIDDIITPLMFGFNGEQAFAYFISSFTAMIPQTICAVITTAVFTFPLVKLFSAIRPVKCETAGEKSDEWSEDSENNEEEPASEIFPREKSGK